MSRTFGVGPCVLAGFKHTKGDCIIYMDSDLQDPPELIEKLIKEYENGAEVVHTIRTKRLGERTNFCYKSSYKIINFLSDIKLPVEAGDFKLISRPALNKILDQDEFRLHIRGLSVWVVSNRFTLNMSETLDFLAKLNSLFFIRTSKSVYKRNYSLFFKPLAE